MIIVATNNAYPAPLVLYVPESAKRHQASGETKEKMIELLVNSFDELRFVIAAIHKFVGIPYTDGQEWKDL